MRDKTIAISTTERSRHAVEVCMSDLLTQRIAARALVLAASRKVGTSRSGLKDSKFRGRGVDYVESRIYQHGDDIRNMDWRVTARSGKPHTKLFQEERERAVLLLIDHNPTMHFGTRERYKSVQAARAAAFVAWSAVRGGDRIGAIGYGNGIMAECKPAGGPRGALRCLRALAEWDESARSSASVPNTPLSEGLQRTQRLARPGSLILIFTDGYSADEAGEASLARLAMHGDVRIILCTDAIESTAPPAGRYAIARGSLRRVLEFGSERSDARWVEAFRSRRTILLDQARRLGVSVMELDTREDLARSLAPLGLALASRGGRR